MGHDRSQSSLRDRQERVVIRTRTHFTHTLMVDTKTDVTNSMFVPNYEHTMKRDPTVHFVARTKESLAI